MGIVLVLGENGEEIFVNNHPLSQSQSQSQLTPNRDRLNSRKNSRKPGVESHHGTGKQTPG